MSSKPDIKLIRNRLQSNDLLSQGLANKDMAPMNADITGRRHAPFHPVTGLCFSAFSDERDNFACGNVSLDAFNIERRLRLNLGR
jgi:hypothetical protein